MKNMTAASSKRSAVYLKILKSVLGFEILAQSLILKPYAWFICSCLLVAMADTDIVTASVLYHVSLYNYLYRILLLK